jgi:fermentation-respiration switch protein FrsA (DUF1100 family)
MLLRWFEHSQVYHPARELMVDPAVLGIPFEEIWLSVENQRLHAWFFPAPEQSSRREFALLHCHGNAGNIGDLLERAGLFHQAGLNLFLFDYRGYGKSAGKPSEAGTYADARAAFAWLRQRGFAASEIVLLGESLGGAIATELALGEPELGGLILQSTFTSIIDIGSEIFPWLPVRWMARIRYATRDKLPRVKMPVLILHSRADDLVGFHHAERNFAAAPEPKLFLEIEGDHATPLENSALYRRGVEQFIDQMVVPRSRKPT